MSNPSSFLSVKSARALVASAAIAAGLALPGAASAADLPAPYVSRALDAVLIPIDDAVRGAFGLAGDESGVLVLAVQEGGVASAAGVAPGDIIAMVHGRAVAEPITLDEIVYYWINQGSFDFGFDGWRSGAAQTYTTTITMDAYMEVIDVTTVESWSSYSSESFSYSEYTTEYSSEISSSYESSESIIEETASSSEFATEETTTEETTTEDTTETTEQTATEETATEDTSATQDSESDQTATEEPAAEEPAAEEPDAEEPAAEEPAAEDPPVEE